ncbi:hypothetical protein [uncultured Roseibium sp.]|uniref:hypothetical protein n=1 Tax=uncultured Roseibium sp. TaxID=1936171 RepID=UPI00321758AD
MKEICFCREAGLYSPPQKTIHLADLERVQPVALFRFPVELPGHHRSGLLREGPVDVDIRLFLGDRVPNPDNVIGLNGESAHQTGACTWRGLANTFDGDRRKAPPGKGKTATEYSSADLTPFEIALSDDRERAARMAIPNIIPQVIVLLFYITAVFFDAPITMILGNTLCAAVVMVALFGVFAIGYIGGGGAKLIASLSIWLGFTKALGYFLAINAAILIMAVPVLIIVRALLKKDTPTGIPILPIALLIFLAVFPNSDLFRHISPRFEMMIAGFLPRDTVSQPPLPATGAALLRTTILPGFKDIDAGLTRQTAGPAGREDGQ